MAAEAATMGVINGAMLVGGKIADLQGLERPLAVFQRPARQRHAQRTGKHLGIERQDCGGEGHTQLLGVERNGGNLHFDRVRHERSVEDRCINLRSLVPRTQPSRY